MSEPFKICQVCKATDGWWTVEYFDAEGICDYALFYGPNAEQWARQCADWMNGKHSPARRTDYASDYEYNQDLLKSTNTI